MGWMLIDNYSINSIRMNLSMSVLPNVPLWKDQELTKNITMLKLLVILLASAIPALTAEIPSRNLLEKQEAFKPDLKTEPIQTHTVFKKESKPETDHPVYRGEQYPQGRAHIEPVRPKGPIITNDPMLADQPSESTELNRIDELTIPGYAYVPTPTDIAYPDIPYAPGYGYDSGYAPKNYDMYGNVHNSYLMEPDTSTFGLLWSQVPDSRTMVSYVGRTITWIFSSIFVLLLGSLLTVGVCSYTNLCTITFHGVGPIHEEMRALMTPERLEKISTAADFVKTAIDKYQKIQKVTDVESTRTRQALPH